MNKPKHFIQAMSNKIRGLFKPKPRPLNTLFIGIDYACFCLAEALLQGKAGRPVTIAAFIDDEPWNNRTSVLGSTVYSPSEISALVPKHQVDMIIQIEGESLEIASNIWQGILATGVKVLTLNLDQDLNEQLDTVREHSLLCRQ
ncbi:hypothetical protein [Marinomonas sp. THO17]|uniref:nucleoside-diphosphate sugar epimerase/dehydratase n=1 Tax=Marinomonas sp. THO17 TaxID=3149048 RepID=UPI00336C05DB